MIREMGSRTQIQEWMAYDEDEPFGERRADYHAAQVVAAFVNMHRNTKKFPELFPVAAFLLQFGQQLREIKAAPPLRKDWRELKAIAKVWAQIYNEDNEKKIRREQLRKNRRPKLSS